MAKNQEPTSASPGRQKSQSNRGGTVSMQKLEKQRAKLKASGQSTAEVDKQIEAIIEWMKAFKKSCALTEGELKKELKRDLHGMHKTAMELTEMREQLRLEMPSENERK
jgi:glutamyl/glutaminyl-tRNA synthetase